MKFLDDHDDTTGDRTLLSAEERSALDSVCSDLSRLARCSGCGLYFRAMHTIGIPDCPGPGTTVRDHCDTLHEDKSACDTLVVPLRVAMVMVAEGTWPRHLLKTVPLPEAACHAYVPAQCVTVVLGGGSSCTRRRCRKYPCRGAACRPVRYGLHVKIV